MDAQSQLLIYGVLPEHKIYGGRTKEGSQTGLDSSTPEGVPLPSYRYGRERDLHAKLFLRRNRSDVVQKYGLREPTGNVGQPANGNLQYLRCQCEIG